MTEEIKNQILEGYAFSKAEVFKGFVIILDDNKVWRSSKGSFLFPTEADASTCFYSEMRPIVREKSGENTILSWKNFKNLCKYQICEV